MISSTTNNSYSSAFAAPLAPARSPLIDQSKLLATNGVIVPGAAQRDAAKPPNVISASAEAEARPEGERTPAAIKAELAEASLQEIRQLAARDREVRSHEQAHMAIAGRHAGGVQYSYERGPDGRLYAVAGEVAINASPVSGDPQATIEKMQQVRRAALAPAEPSSQDRAVAAQAAQLIAQARAELASAEPADKHLGVARGDGSDMAKEESRELNLYRDVAALPDSDDSTPAWRA